MTANGPTGWLAWNPLALPKGPSSSKVLFWEEGASLEVPAGTVIIESPTATLCSSDTLRSQESHSVSGGHVTCRLKPEVGGHQGLTLNMGVWLLFIQCLLAPLK
ncbi:hypothetical protein AAFF_G00129700 [Aldrovandia affinis]|uniref:Uncharacterized protein n=1 Tax=Aldrovandia affinis TaxID=143900 RepID=A0AAD7W9C9_9TELE|nr:hypothetical protein AAFF_G00129700 [Aldrovandia affinis]